MTHPAEPGTGPGFIPGSQAEQDHLDELETGLGPEIRTGYTTELSGDGVSGRDEITPAYCGHGYRCVRCGGTGTTPTHAPDCPANARASTLWATPSAVGARAALADVDARRDEFLKLPGGCSRGEYDDARDRMRAAEAHAANKLAGLLSALDNAAGAR